MSNNDKVKKDAQEILLNISGGKCESTAHSSFIKKLHLFYLLDKLRAYIGHA